jgi:hypothetical protein
MSTFSVGVKTNKNKEEISILRFGPERAETYLQELIKK